MSSKDYQTILENHRLQATEKYGINKEQDDVFNKAITVDLHVM